MLAGNPAALVRLPWFCPGCPHNSSTRVPEGSVATAGIGCHFMTTWMGRETTGFTQMGGEGASWLGQAPFSTRQHMFQNVGDGTFYHSGSLAVRAAKAAGANITFKILYNDAVAMTGGQKMETANLAVPQVARLLESEGVETIVVVTDEPDKYPLGTAFPAGMRVHHRDELDAVQRQLRTVPGVSALIYDQTCAAEKRRRRKRGEFPDPDRRVVINELVCEGCGDCGVQSNCVAVQPVETELGRKRRIDQSACNKDFSCLKGFCPSFVTVHGGRLRRGGVGGREGPFPVLPEPVLPELTDTYGIVVTGVGGTGVITIAALLGMAAHLEGKGVVALDMVGLAQKGGAVVSHIKLAPEADRTGSPRVAAGGAVAPAGLRPRGRCRAHGAAHRGCGGHARHRQQRGGDDGGLHPEPRPPLPGQEAAAGAGRRGGRGAGRAGRCHAARHQAHRRCDRHQPLHGRLCLAAGPHPSDPRVDRARDRAQRRRGLPEPAGVRLGPAGGARSRPPSRRWSGPASPSGHGPGRWTS